MPYALTVLDGVRWHGRTVVGHRPRALLEALVGGGNTGCSGERLIEAVWGDDRPSNPTKALQVLVSRVRTATDSRAVERTERGYRLGLDRTEVDAFVREDLLAAARTAYDRGRYDEAARSLRRARDLHPDAEADALLALASSRAGDHRAALPLLEELASERPTDEEALCCLLRSEAAVRGPAAALDRFERYRAELADRLGSDPGPSVRAVHRELLAADRPRRSGVRYDATPLLGRDDDVRNLIALLGASRAVSIVGAGGLGKTRLAHVLGRDTDRPVVHFVELVGVTSPGDVVGEVGSVLGVRDSVAVRHALTPEQRADVRARIAQHLDAAPTLLILDNCEQVVDAVADLVAFLVATTRDLRVVTTTRAPLGIAAERVYALNQLDPVDAVELFRERAMAVRPNVVLDAGAVEAVVARLDGLPLAIELAAAKARVMSVEDIGRRLADRFALLRGADRSAPDRHRTLLAVIDWSWNLLTEGQRRAQRRLSVFQDGFTLDAAEAVLGDGAPDELEELVRQSLLTVGEAGSTVRYRMLETVREFGRMRLVDAGEDADAMHALRSWARAYARANLGRLMGPRQFDAIDAIHAEEGNLGDILRQSIAEPDRETAVAVLAALASYWSVTGEHARILLLADAFDAAVAGWSPPPDLVDETLVAVCVLLANVFIVHPTYPPAMCELLKRIGPESTDPGIAAMCEVVQALDPVDGGPDRIDVLCEDDDRLVAIRALQYRCHRLENDGHPESAIGDATRALELSAEEDGPWQSAFLHTQLGQLYGQLGHHDRAAEHARLAIPTLDRLRSTDDATQSRVVLAVHAMLNGRLAEAEERVGEIRRIAAERPGFNTSPVAATGEAELAILRGDVDAGLRRYRASLEHAREIRFPGAGEPTGMEPWTLFGESACLTAYALHGQGDDGSDLWDLLRSKVLRVTDPPRPHLDYPVAGLVLFGLGAWGLVREALPAPAAVRLLVLADRFAYARFTPTMQWENAAAPAERVAPGLIDEIGAEYGDRRGKELLPEARTFLVEQFG